MVHAFSVNGKYLVYDTMGGSLFEIDKITHDILNQGTLNEEDLLKAFYGKYSEQDIKEALEELLELKNEEMLFCEIDESKIKKPHGMSIKSMCLHVAHDCNLRCKYCFAETGDFGGPRGIMSLETGKKAIDFLLEQSVGRKNLELDFFGGEPFMNLDVVKELVKYGREREKECGKVFRFTITTNAMIMKQEDIDFLNKEMYNVVLSIDGRKEVHDRMRKDAGGKGSYDTAMKNAKKFLNQRGEEQYYVRGTFSAYNLDFTQDVLSLIDNGFEQISIEPAVVEDKYEYAIKEEHLPTIYKEYEKLVDIYLDKRKNGPWFNFFHFMLDLEDGPCLYKRLSGCGAGCEYIAVTPEGEIYPCHQFVGDKDYLLGTLDDGIKRKDIMDTFACSTVLTKEDCKNCWAKYLCSGGCSANAYKYNGSISKPHKISCELEKKRLECALYARAMEKEV